MRMSGCGSKATSVAEVAIPICWEMYPTVVGGVFVPSPALPNQTSLATIPLTCVFMPSV